MIIGDSWRDMVAGHAMGLDAIGVMTGHALRHSPPSEFWTSGRPDVVAEDLSQAVSLLLDEDPAIAASSSGRGPVITIRRRSPRVTRMGLSVGRPHLPLQNPD